MRISAICVTENRPAFLPWMLEQFRKQHICGALTEAELVIVDSSEDTTLVARAVVAAGVQATVLLAPVRTAMGPKRNMGLAAATGDGFVNWDDDDWHHPLKLSWIADGLTIAPLCGWRQAWSADLRTNRVMTYTAHPALPFETTIGVRTELARKHRRPAHDNDDTIFRDAVLTELRSTSTAWHLHPRNVVHMIMLRHGGNVVQKSALMSGSHFEQFVAQHLSADVWQDTAHHLDKLRARLRGDAVE